MQQSVQVHRNSYRLRIVQNVLSFYRLRHDILQSSTTFSCNFTCHAKKCKRIAMPVYLIKTLNDAKIAVNWVREWKWSLAGTAIGDFDKSNPFNVCSIDRGVGKLFQIGELSVSNDVLDFSESALKKLRRPPITIYDKTRISVVPYATQQKDLDDRRTAINHLNASCGSPRHRVAPLDLKDGKIFRKLGHNHFIGDQNGQQDALFPYDSCLSVYAAKRKDRSKETIDDLQDYIDNTSGSRLVPDYSEMARLNTEERFLPIDAVYIGTPFCALVVCLTEEATTEAIGEIKLIFDTLGVLFNDSRFLKIVYDFHDTVSAFHNIWGIKFQNYVDIKLANSLIKERDYQVVLDEAFILLCRDYIPESVPLVFDPNFHSTSQLKRIQGPLLASNLMFTICLLPLSAKLSQHFFDSECKYLSYKTQKIYNAYIKMNLGINKERNTDAKGTKGLIEINVGDYLRTMVYDQVAADVVLFKLNLGDYKGIATSLRSTSDFKDLHRGDVVDCIVERIIPNRKLIYLSRKGRENLIFHPVLQRKVEIPYISSEKGEHANEQYDFD